jgi:hypothetical protein
MDERAQREEDRGRDRPDRGGEYPATSRSKARRSPREEAMIMTERDARDRAESDPIGLEADWEGATQEGTGRYSMNDAVAEVRDVTPPAEAAEDDPVVNGYKGGDRRTELPIEQIRRVPIPKPPPQDY